MHELFRWLERTSFSVFIRRSTWGFALIEMVHLLGLAAFGGSLLVINLRLLGIGLRRQPVSRLARELWPLLLCSLAVMLVSGALLVTTAPMKYYYSPAFRLKMVLFILAVTFSLFLQPKVVRLRPSSPPPLWSKAAAVISLALWLGVGLAGRAIGFFG